MQEKHIDDMTTAELRAALSEFERQSRPTHQAPDAPGCAGLSDKSRETARELYGQAVMGKQPCQLNSEEREFLRASIRAVAKDMGY